LARFGYYDAIDADAAVLNQRACITTASSGSPVDQQLIEPDTLRLPFCCHRMTTFMLLLRAARRTLLGVPHSMPYLLRSGCIHPQGCIGTKPVVSFG
ncbi:MAG: hypothetical protein JWO42_1613, partial [Chloroflexi bacterium]|nr:hypothetical protein [Chloroflexota bacterium]